MSLSIALSNALSSLQFTQTAMQVTSNNVANATTEGYSRKIVESLSRQLGGQGAGVDISNIVRVVDENLIRELRDETADIKKFLVSSEFFGRMQDMFGTLSSNSSLAANVSELATAIEALTATPEDTNLRQQVVRAAVVLTNQINTMAAKLQDMRAEADQRIAPAVNIINTQLQNIAEINVKIVRATASGQPVADLEDMRDKAIMIVAEYLDIRAFTRGTGEISLITKGGTSLVGGGTAAVLSHTPAGGVDASVTVFDGINIGATDITPEIGSGRLAALISMRDTDLPNLNAEIDQLATQLRDIINAVHNDGTGFPPPNALTGTRIVAGANAFAGTGTVRIAVVDAAGNMVNSFDMALAGLADVDAVMAAINDVANLGNDATAAIVGGKLVISADVGANAIVINERTSVVTDGPATKGFSHYFGLNDFFIGDGTVSLARTIAVRADIVANPQLLSRGELSDAVLVVGAPAITAGNNTVVLRLADAFTQNVSFTVSGALPAMTTTLTDFGAQILAQNATAAADADREFEFREGVFEDLKFRADSVSGVNIDEEMANLILLQNSFIAAARVISITAELLEVISNLGR